MFKDKNKRILIGIGFGILILGIFVLIFNKSMNSQNKNDVSNNNLSPTTSESPTFENTIWLANSIGNNEIIANSSISVQFDNQGRITGSDGCNNFNGSYKLNGSQISINSDLISTKKACEENIMKQADAFTKLLLASTSYLMGDGIMKLLQGKEEGLSFTGSTNSLAKTSWNISGYNNGNEAVVGPIANTNPTITFADDGTISGNSGCNTYSGTYSLNGNSISISALASTQRECFEPEGIMEQESSLLSYLQKADTWLIQGNQLYLRTAEDQLAVTAVNNSTTGQ